MEKREIKLKAKKESPVVEFFKKKKNRFILAGILILPFLIAIGFFGYRIFTEVNALKSLATGTTETKQENIVESVGYVLRDNATDLQKDYFKQLKEAIEGEEKADDVTIAGLVAKNYVADFYTWTNKQGQFDVGGMHYIYDGEYENGDHFKENVYENARYGFYKYISTYMSDYGADKLLEVTDVELTKCEKAPWKFHVSEHIANKQDENGEWYDYREDRDYDAYLVSCKWTYNEETSLTLSQFPTSINLLIINKNGSFEIVEASEGEIKERKIKVKDESTESDKENAEEDSDESTTETESESTEG